MRPGAATLPRTAGAPKVETTMFQTSIFKGSIARCVALWHTDNGASAPIMARGMEQRRYEYDHRRCVRDPETSPR
jgi:hypothetical protein